VCALLAPALARRSSRPRQLSAPARTSPPASHARPAPDRQAPPRTPPASTRDAPRPVPSRFSVFAPSSAHPHSKLPPTASVHPLVNVPAAPAGNKQPCACAGRKQLPPVSRSARIVGYDASLHAASCPDSASAHGHSRSPSSRFGHPRSRGLTKYTYPPKGCQGIS
jgi:hypothetical protein